jgi:Pyridoxamine 5'-phosphate oxidase
MVESVWSDEDDEVIGGDLTAALAYATPAGGAVVTPVAPIGLRDREAGSISFTTSLGFGRKLERIERNPRVALAYHAREHGFSSSPRFVLAQGQATYDAHPDRETLEQRIGPASMRFMGAPRRGAFWDRWLDAYYSDRVVVNVRVERVISWPDLACVGDPTVVGAPLAGAELDSQAPPGNGTGPRLDAQRAARALRKLPHVLLGHIGCEGYPEVAPVAIGSAGAEGIALLGSVPAGARRAGLLAHRYGSQLVGLEIRQHTGWLHDGSYAPHTAHSVRAPANKTVLLLANGYMAKRGLKRARAQAQP